MNFKMEYEKAFADISADDAFKKRLENELNNRSVPRTRIKPYAGTLVAAAALMLMVGAVHYTGVIRDIGEQPDAVQESSDVMADEIDDWNTKGFIPQLNWYSGVEGDEEKYALFCSFISGEELETLYCSDEQVFTEDDIVSAEQADLLADKLTNAVSVSGAEEDKIKYYKAVLKDNRTIVFEIWDEEYISITGIETIYKIEKIN